MTDLYCRKIDCINNEGELYRDCKGTQGCCKLKENQIDRNGKCSSYEEKK